jgi:serine/threonine protein kinase/Tol biopolymer transport system component
MSTGRKNEKEIFQTAMQLDTPSQRAAYLDSVCGDDPAHKARILALLQAHETGDHLLDPLLADADILMDGILEERPGTVIGPAAPLRVGGRYKLLEKIGEGGMAVVYMAEQTDPIRRKVALKIIKLGMDTRQVIARFEAERQALALMDHPSIAKVLDAGATETGRPYFVMELVAGVSITEYCDKNSLSTKDRLALFLQVCHAVQHAHQKGIIHRDVKPSNVMVTHHDGKPVPKVIDFGIAKAINQRLTEKTLFTRYAHIIGTPAYMSPEQAELSDLDIDTRSDIYSLGVLLYELLTGTTPFSEEELRKAGYVEMQRVIREQEPVRPSTKLSTLGETLTDIAKCRNSTPDLLRRAVRGDLDWIVMRTLEKDRARRYETASGLAEDIRRHLAHEPVVARGPSTTYRLRKFLRRHRVQTITALAVILLAGAAVVLLSLWNRDRAQLIEAEGFRDHGILFLAREQYAKGNRDAALDTIRPILNSRHVGPEARLLHAGILVENRRSKEAVTILNGLLDDRPETTGAAHALLARILWETGSQDAHKLEEIEEHRQRAEALLPETAEAYFLRAMTAPTIKEQLAALDRALQLDPKHYEARRSRTLTHYASRKYGPMSEDAAVMEALRDRDPLGHGLRATALRELGRYEEALAKYDSALARTPRENPQYLDLTTQRLETLMRTGRYNDVVTMAQEAIKRWPDRPVFPYHMFGALTALGDFDGAAAVFQKTVHSMPTARNEFRLWATKYVFDTLGAARSWHPPGRKPTGPAFLPLAEAEETYCGLSAKGHRVLTDGFSAQWSPDGKKLAFSAGVHGYSGVAIYDLATKETELLIVAGKDARWSPDGKHIAFVRDCQFLRVSELIGAEPRNQDRMMGDEEVWVMNGDGTEPRHLARGGWPSWSQDSRCVYYQSRLDSVLYSIPITGRAAKPTEILANCGSFPLVSPDNQRVAYSGGVSLKILDLSSRSPNVECRVPSVTWTVTGWSPKADELCLGAGANDKTGLWIFDLCGRESRRILDGRITSASWSPTGTQLAFCLGQPYFEIWVAALDPNVPTVEALGPSQTMEEYSREMLAFYTRRIAADPQDAWSYSSRARYYDDLHDQEKMNADMQRFSSILNGSPPQSQVGRRRVTCRAVDCPFDCQLVLSADRQEDGTEVLCVAFGQKGRCAMKLFEIPMVFVSLAGLSSLFGFDPPLAHANFTFGTPVNLGPVVNSAGSDFTGSISGDELSLFFSSNRAPGGYQAFHLWVATRPSKDEAWGTPVHLGADLNSEQNQWTPCLSADGLSLYFSKGWYTGDLWVARRNGLGEPWGVPESLGPAVNGPGWNMGPSISADGLELFFCSTRPGGYGGPDLYVTKRATISEPWGPAMNLGPTINTSYGNTLYGEWSPNISPDGLVLFFASARPPGSASNLDLWMTRRTTRDDPWEPPTHLGYPVNSASHESGPCVSSDGRTLYFSSGRPGGSGGDSDFWQVPLIPIVDFNGDGKVDAADMAILADNWGRNDSVCDIGPMPWGDGIVDTDDLRVLVKEMTGSDIVMKPLPHTLEVPRDACLSWTPVPLAETYDVYMGTSREEVKSADRSNPRGVLAVKGQMTTTYDPEGLLDYGRTYYWRVDFVSAGPAPTIYRGSVRDFTTEPLARAITSIAATDSSSQGTTGPWKTVDGSGLDNDGHSTDEADMWLTTSVPPHWIQFEFDKIYTLHEMWIWNFNHISEPLVGFGAKTVKIEYSADGTTWTALANVPEFAQAPGKAGYTANTIVSFAGVPAKFAKLTIEKNWGVAPQTGLSEVRFFCIQSAAVPKP